MLNSIKTRKKRQPLAATIMANMRMVTTLSDRLKQAGIRELVTKEQPTEKSKRLKKKNMKRSYSEKYIYDDLQNNPGKKKKLLKLHKYFFVPHDTNNNQNENKYVEMPFHFSEFSEEFNKNIEGSAKQTIYVSLDFLKDCKQYKKKFRNPNGDSDTRAQRKSIGSFPGGSYMYLNNRGKILRFEDNLDKLYTKKRDELDFIESRKDFLFEELSSDINTSTNFKSELQELSQIKASTNALPSDDVAKIDQKYLQSLLCLANGGLHQTVNKSQEKITNKKLSEKKISKRKSKEKNAELTNSTDSKIKNKTPSNKKSTMKNSNLQLQTENSCEIKNDADQQKKQNMRAAFFKMKKPTPKYEGSKMSDVKELWRRNSHESSDNSLTSHSSIAAPDNDDIPAWKNLGLESYKMLKKLVEKEISKIAKVSEKTQSKEDVVKSDAVGDAKIIKKQTKNPENLNQTKYINKNSESTIKKQLKQAEYQVYNSPYEGNKEKSELRNLITNDKMCKTQTQQPIDKWDKSKKNLTPIVENWSILNRLEKAFLALGTPAFPKKNLKNVQPISSKTITTKTDKTQEERFDKKYKTPRKSIEYVNKDNKNEPVTKENLAKMLQYKYQELSKQNLLKEKQQIAKPKKETQPSKTVFEAKAEEKETNAEKKATKFSPRIPRRVVEKKTNPELVPQFYMTESKLPIAKKSNQNPKLASNSLIPTRQTKISSNKSSKTSMSEKTLERKKTFEIIQTEDSSSNKSLKSNSRNKIPEQDRKNQKEERKTKPIENLLGITANLKIPKNIKTREKQSDWGEKMEVDDKTLPDEIFTGIQIIPIDDWPSQILEKKEFSKNCSERAIKERSILSMRGSTQYGTELDKKIVPELPSTKTCDLAKKVLENLNEQTEKSSASCLSAGTYDVHSNVLDEVDKEQFDFSEKFTSSSSLSSYNFDLYQDYRLEKYRMQSEDAKTAKNQTLWEQDIRHYRALVKEIMSHYNRLNGFLKQSGYAEDFFENSTNALTTNEIYNEASLLSDKLRNANIQEYRKKIISEYQALPIYEYKNRMQKDKKADSEQEEQNKKHLSVVKDVKVEKDLDVKDYRPNIQKVLGSQLYVDVKNLAKCKEKKPSLQEMKTKNVKKGECSRSYSIPRTYLPMPCSQTLVSISENLTDSKSDEFYLANETSDDCAEGKSQSSGLVRPKHYNIAYIS